MLPDPPAASFASDNASGAHPLVLEAMAAVNDGPALAYGWDDHSIAVAERVRAVFGFGAEVLFCWGGTGANMVGLQAHLLPYEAVVCAAPAHINVDEGGAAERLIGAKLIDIPTDDGKLRPDDLLDHPALLASVRGVVHHAQPRILSLTQSTETGLVYSLDELADLREVADERGWLIHMDGARMANAVAALGCTPAEVTAGVDVLSFGGTKNGMVHGEIVVVRDGDRAEAARFAQKQFAQLPSKMRFIAAQFDALLTDDRWLRWGGHANAMAARLARGAETVDGVTLSRTPQTNAVFARLPEPARGALAAWSPFYVWDETIDEVRWMTSWSTTEPDVDRFVEGLAAVSPASR